MMPLLLPFIFDVIAFVFSCRFFDMRIFTSLYCLHIRSHILHDATLAVAREKRRPYLMR